MTMRFQSDATHCVMHCALYCVMHGKTHGAAHAEESRRVR